MKSLRTVRYSLLAAAVAGGAMFSTTAAADVSASAAVSSLYLWRGLNLGGGTPVVSGSLDYSHSSGLFAGVWGSSAGPDSEIDLYAGYAYSSDAFGFKVTGYDYSYPRAANTPTFTEEGAKHEVVLSVSASGFFADAIIGLGDFKDGNYYDVGYTMGKFTGKVGMTDAEDLAGPDTDYTHADLTYAYNERLSFTVSGIVDQGDAGTIDPDALFVVTYTLPLELK